MKSRFSYALAFYLRAIVSCLLQAIVSHAEHDTVYVMDWACRSFSYSTLRTMIEVVLENMPAGKRPHVFCHMTSS